MDDEELPRMFDQFVDAAKRGTKRGGIRGLKMTYCKIALNLSDQLVRRGYIFGSRYDVFNEYISKVYAISEGESETIERIAREFFLTLHTGDWSDFSIKFSEKEEGMSIGLICDVKYSQMNRRFYIKCHQRGPRPNSSSIAGRYSSINRPYVQELYVYKLLSLINVCGETHFPMPIASSTKKIVYIATGEVVFTTAKELTLERADPKAIILVDFLQFVLRLEDIATNAGNWGQNDEGEPVIIDFWVRDDQEFHLSDKQIDDFWEKQHVCHSRLIADVLKMVTNDQRKEIIRVASEKWLLEQKMEEAKSAVEDFLVKNGERLEISGDLNRYVRGTKSNIEKMIRICSNKC